MITPTIPPGMVRIGRSHRFEQRSPIKITANLSRNHPDYGCTVAEHERRKAVRS